MTSVRHNTTNTLEMYPTYSKVSLPVVLYERQMCQDHVKQRDKKHQTVFTF